MRQYNQNINETNGNGSSPTQTEYWAMQRIGPCNALDPSDHARVEVI